MNCPNSRICEHSKRRMNESSERLTCLLARSNRGVATMVAERVNPMAKNLNMGDWFGCNRLPPIHNNCGKGIVCICSTLTIVVVLLGIVLLLMLRLSNGLSQGCWYVSGHGVKRWVSLAHFVSLIVCWYLLICYLLRLKQYQLTVRIGRRHSKWREYLEDN